MPCRSIIKSHRMLLWIFAEHLGSQSTYGGNCQMQPWPKCGLRVPLVSTSKRKDIRPISAEEPGSFSSDVSDYSAELNDHFWILKWTASISLVLFRMEWLQIHTLYYHSHWVRSSSFPDVNTPALAQSDNWLWIGQSTDSLYSTHPTGGPEGADESRK